MCRHPHLILEGATPHPPHRHDDRRTALYRFLSRNAGNLAWHIRKHRFDVACAAVFVSGVVLAIGTAQPSDAGFAVVVRDLITSAVRG